MDADQFLQTIFDQYEGAVVTVNERFITRRWKSGQDLSNQVYFCISTVADRKPRQNSGLSRKSTDLVLTYVVVLDDIGTKVAVSRELERFQPTYKLETSPGNQQWGYVFEDPVEPARAAALIEALAAAGLTDPGAKGAARVMRFPGSLNAKYDPPFAAALVEWHPERLYSYTDICLGLGVTPTDTPTLTFKSTDLPAGVVDPIVPLLYEEGLVLGPVNASGWIPITCPLEAEHTGEIDHGTDYRPGMPGVFKCLHSHGDRLGTSWFRSWLAERRPDADLALISGEALLAIGAKLRGSLGVISRGDGVTEPAGAANATGGIFEALRRQAAAGSMFGASSAAAELVQSDRDEIVEAILGDIIHVASESCFWSVDARCFLDAKAVDNRWYPVMERAGLLDRPKRQPMKPHEWLMQQAGMVRVARVTHRLGKPLIVDDCLNLAPVMPLPVEYCGEPAPWLELISFICKGNAEDIEWVLDWCALVVTGWSEKPGFHLILKGRQGTGKNLAMLPLVAYLQPEHHQLVSTAMIGGQFNAFLTRRLLSIDELKMTTRGAATAHDIYNNLKAWTARGADTITINEKNMKHFQAADRSCWVITSNEAVPLPLEDDDRRFMVIETPRTRQPKTWYKGIYDWLADGGQAMVIGWLQRRWDEMDVGLRQGLRETAPMTEAKAELLDDAAEGIDGAVRMAIAGKHGEAWPNLMKLDDAIAKLDDPTHSPLTDSMRRNHLNRKRVAMALKNAGAVQLFKGQTISDKTRTMRLWCVRPLKVEQYERLGQGKALLDEYANQQSGIVPREMNNVIPYKPSSKT